MPLLLNQLLVSVPNKEGARLQSSKFNQYDFQFGTIQKIKKFFVGKGEIQIDPKITCHFGL